MLNSAVKPLRIVVIVVGFIIVVGLASLVALYVFASNTLDNRNSMKQAEMMELVLEWGRFAPFPASATNISVETEGSSFTRSFRARFRAPNEDIQAWLASSPGIQDATAEVAADGTMVYSITPGGGANRAEVTVDDASNSVEIYVSWS